jgi:hypothetical protein
MYLKVLRRVALTILSIVLMSPIAAFSQQAIDESQFTWPNGKTPNSFSIIKDPSGKTIGASVKDVDLVNDTESIHIYSTDFSAVVHGVNRTIRIHYFSVGHIHQWESGECNISCNLTCSVTFTQGSLKASISVLVEHGEYSWSKEREIPDAYNHVGDSCASFNLYRFRNATFGTYDSWKPTIDSDIQAIKDSNVPF